MNKTILTLVVAAFLATNARAALLLSDDFNSYPDGSLVGAPGSPWIHHSGSTTGEVNVVSGRVSLTSSETEDVSAALSGGPYSAGSGVTLYTSFTVSFSSLPNNAGTYFAHFRDSTNGFRDRIWASTTGAAPGEFRIGIGNGSSATALSGQVTADLSLNTTYLVVTRYDISANQSTIWLDPTAETDPNVTASDLSTPLDVNTLAFRQNAGMGTLLLDDVKVGTTFADVVPEPSALALCVLGAAGLFARRLRRRIL